MYGARPPHTSVSFRTSIRNVRAPKGHPCASFAPLGLLLVAGPALAQADRDRYDLGRRAHAFEVAWDEKADDPAARKRAVPHVDRAVKHFLGFDLAAGARDMDAARHALESADPPPPAVRWADSLQVLPETHVVDAAAADVLVVVKQYYKPAADAPKDVILRVRLGTGKPVEVPLDSLPATVRVQVKDVPGPPSADFKLTADIVADGQGAVHADRWRLPRRKVQGPPGRRPASRG